MSYGDLTEGERAHWDEYTNLRQISDWPGFDAEQDQRRADSRTWLQERRAYIYDLAEGNIEGEEPGWNVANRRERYDQLADEQLNAGAPKHEYRLPAPGTMTDPEKVYTEEREAYLAFGSTTDAQKARKQKNVDWLVTRRKKLWHLMDDDPGGNEANDRQARYDAVCVATHHGQAWEDYEKTHNKYGQPYTDDPRDDCVKWLRKHLGTSENPPNSNTGRDQPSGWQDRVYGDDGVPWCACFSVCSAWDAGVSGTGTAAVSNNIDLAKRGEGIYKGYTTNPDSVRAGDHAMIGCSTCHTGVVASDNDPWHTIEGNTSPGSEGSQYNGGCVAERQRGKSEIIGWGLVRF